MAADVSNPRNGRRRVVIERVRPEIDAGRFPAKRSVGEDVLVEADVFCDGHDVLAAEIRFRRAQDRDWLDAPMAHVENDRWQGRFPVTDLGRYRFTVRGWVDRFASWRRDFGRKVEAGQDVSVDILTGAELVERAIRRGKGGVGRELRRFCTLVKDGDVDAALDDELAALVARAPDRSEAVTYERELEVLVDPPDARFSTWYELFPRSTAPTPGRHGTFKDVEARLGYVEDLGFDVLYLPPIHPIGHTNRKGPNNTSHAGQRDPGSPWGIGSGEGGHKAVHPDLGTIEDFDHLVATARDRHGIEVALDVAFQCSPDHPYVKTNPEWFKHRPDGTVQFAENPPKRYEDIYPLDFESESWRELWDELKSVVEFWIGHGVRIFRVDNPHTKPFRFWEWLIGEVKRDHPEIVFLSEAFTRPKVMYRLAKAGFTQSYTYFAWRNTKHDLIEYLTELTRTEVREYFRPNLWPNTPDILNEYLQLGGRPAFMNRLVLAATLGASYGIYGPAFELMEHEPIRPGSEEYLHSEKYEIRHWDLDRDDSLAPFIARVNRIRRENAALQSNERLWFLPIDNDQLIAYTKFTEDRDNVIVMVVNLDPGHTQSGWLGLPLADLGLDPSGSFQVHDLLTDARFLWEGEHNFVELNPHVVPAHVFRIRHHVRNEHDFEYYL
ncbi:MAG: alpha-1,4-glucan--maltose-1-phosphate maltosyltransferase [Actinomycetota bacterium]